MLLYSHIECVDALFGHFRLTPFSLLLLALILVSSLSSLNFFELVSSLILFPRISTFFKISALTSCHSG